MSIKFNGTMCQSVTFKAAAPISPNTPVYVSANETVAAAEDSKVFIGICENYSKGLAGVRIYGYAELPYTSTGAPSVGPIKLTANGAGGVKVDANGRQCVAVKVDTVNKIIGFFM